MGAHIVDVKVPEVNDIMDILQTISRFDALKFHSQYYPERKNEYGDFLREWLDIAAEVTESEYAEALAQEDVFRTRFNTTLDSVDAIITPAGGVPFEISAELHYAGLQDLGGALKTDFRFTAPANLAGVPTLTLPCGASDNGLPHSIQFWCKQLSERLLCRIGHAYEENTKWHSNHPPI